MKNDVQFEKWNRIENDYLFGFIISMSEFQTVNCSYVVVLGRQIRVLTNVAKLNAKAMREFGMPRKQTKSTPKPEPNEIYHHTGLGLAV